LLYAALKKDKRKYFSLLTFLNHHQRVLQDQSKAMRKATINLNSPVLFYNSELDRRLSQLLE
jgi:hypothetical protein